MGAVTKAEIIANLSKVAICPIKNVMSTKPVMAVTVVQDDVILPVDLCPLMSAKHSALARP